tara:strand:+ start:1003 stop:1509 length:507 start_codon:yes stop_codon:yes gene_type:complete
MNNSVLLQNFKKNDAINTKIFERNIPSNNLQMNFSSRPVQTKYCLLPVLDNKTMGEVKINNCEIYNSENTFFPGTDKPHFNGFSTCVDKESTLRNINFPLQRADQAKYIPSSTSDLYENPINFITNDNNLNNNLLFKSEEFNDFNPNISHKIGNNIFNNSTRVQLKNL